MTIVVALLSLLLTPQRPPDTRELVRRATEYVAAYTSDLRFVLADEVSTQRTFDERGALTGERQLRGELYLAFLPVDRVWIAVHDVSHVDGAAVARDDLVGLLRQGEVSAVAKRVADRNASFNLGSITRNFNEPTLALLLLTSPRVRQITFDRRATLAHADGLRATLSFRERERPTLVRSRSGAPVFSRGTLTLDAAAGRIEASLVELEHDGIRARLETTYSRDAKIAAWVPATFLERYEGAPNGRREVVTVESSYSNYRRFDVVARIR